MRVKDAAFVPHPEAPLTEVAHATLTEETSPLEKLRRSVHQEILLREQAFADRPLQRHRLRGLEEMELEFLELGSRYTETGEGAHVLPELARKLAKGYAGLHHAAIVQPTEAEVAEFRQENEHRENAEQRLKLKHRLADRRRAQEKGVQDVLELASRIDEASPSHRHSVHELCDEGVLRPNYKGMHL